MRKVDNMEIVTMVWDALEQMNVWVRGFVGVVTSN